MTMNLNVQYIYMKYFNMENVNIIVAYCYSANDIHIRILLRFAFYKEKKYKSIQKEFCYF